MWEGTYHAAEAYNGDVESLSHGDEWMNVRDGLMRLAAMIINSLRRKRPTSLYIFRYMLIILQACIRELYPITLSSKT